MSTSLQHAYNYPFASSLDHRDRRGLLSVATSSGAEPAPHFFFGTVREPRLIADALLVLGLVARSRFYIPPSMLARLIREADPVITSDGSQLRWETFSLCCGVYARLDLLGEGLDGEWLGRGTTNVDFNPPLRAALAKLPRGQQLEIGVGKQLLEVKAGEIRAQERKVPLPLRWLKAFVEVQSYQHRMRLVQALSAAEARKFLSRLPKERGRGEATLVRAGKGLRLSQRKDGELAGNGLSRLRVIEPLIRSVQGLRVYGDAERQASAFELSIGPARLTIALSANVWRGFSGEGQALLALAKADEKRLSAVRAQLRWQALVDPAEIATSCKRKEQDVQRSLALLGAQGLVGYDLAAGGYFHRELPFALEQVASLQPRLRDARRLLDEDAAVVEDQREDEVVVRVRGSGVDHRVRLDEEGARCTCTWFARNRGARGPCKHILAAQILLQPAEGEHGKSK